MLNASLWRMTRFLVLVFAILSFSARSSAQIAVVVSFGPPELPVYEQPFCPGDGYIWTPGYWAWDDDDDDYYWVPGTWVLPPEVGFFWTPGYWAWGGSGFVFYEGYWGPVVGFYGGINYGYGYFGHGYEGGRWDNGRFYYNTTVNHVNVTEIHNVYNTTVVVNNNSRVSYNGGNGGLDARPTYQEQTATHERHIPPVAAQTQHMQIARTNPALRASQNRGKPPIAATARPAAFSGSGVVPAREGGRYNPPPPDERRASAPNSPNRPPSSSHPAGSSTAVHPNDLPPHARPEAPNTGNHDLDRKYQQEQDKLRAKQEREHQQLQQKQEQEHQRLEHQRASDTRKQEMEQRHQRETQQMEQRHNQEQQQMQQRQQPSQPNPKHH